MKKPDLQQRGNGLMEPATIGQVARLAGVGVETIRFYERKGLLDKPPRKHSGYRQYGQEAVAQLRFIKRAKELGFALREIKELQRLWRSREATCEDARKLVEAKVTQTEQRVRELQETRRALKKLSAGWSGKSPLNEVPILEAFEVGSCS